MKKALIIIGLFLLVFIAFLIKSGSDFYAAIYKKLPSKATSILPKVKTDYNILLLGYGGFDDKGVAHDGT